MPGINRDAPKASYSVDDVIGSTGLSRQTIYNEINSGRLKSFKVGRRRLISPAALDAWVKQLEKESA